MLYVEGTFFNNRVGADSQGPPPRDLSEPIRRFCAQHGISAPQPNPAQPLADHERPQGRQVTGGRCLADLAAQHNRAAPVYPFRTTSMQVCAQTFHGGDQAPGCFVATLPMEPQIPCQALLENGRAASICLSPGAELHMGFRMCRAKGLKTYGCAWGAGLVISTAIRCGCMLLLLRWHVPLLAGLPQEY